MDQIGIEFFPQKQAVGKTETQKIKFNKALANWFEKGFTKIYPLEPTFLKMKFGLDAIFQLI